MMNKPKYQIYQNHIDESGQVNVIPLYSLYNEQDAIKEVDRINNNLLQRGIPEWISSAYYEVS